MWKISEMVCLAVLMGLSMIDMKEHMVPDRVLLAAGAGSILYQIICGKESLWLVAGGIGVGSLFLLISKFTSEGMGYGDSMGILVLGIFLGFYRIISVLMTALFLLLCVSIPMLVKRKMSKKAALPFYPFLTGGYLCLLLAERMPL